MNSGLISFVRQAIDCYECDPDAAWTNLDNAENQIASEKNHRAIREEMKAAKSSMKKTGKALRDRLLELDAIHSEKVSPFIDKQETIVVPIRERVQISPKQRMERIRQGHVQRLLDVLVWRENQDRKSKGEASVTRQEVLESMNEDEILSVEECSDWEEIEREYELAARGEPNFELYLLRRHLNWLDSSVNKIEMDGPIRFRGHIPDYLKRYLYEAKWCDLHGFDAACATLCGAILEEALRSKLRELGVHVGKGETVGSVIEIASTPSSKILLPLLADRAKNRALEVMRLRNLTAHGRPYFTENLELNKIDSLGNTIELLETLFEAEV